MRLAWLPVAFLVGLSPCQAGVIGVGPDLADVPPNLVGMRAHLRVNVNASPDFGKVFFTAAVLYDPAHCVAGNCPIHRVEPNFNASWPMLADNLCVDGQPPVLPHSPNTETAFWIATPEVSRTSGIGIRTSDPTLFPRAALWGDSQANNFIMATNYQADVTGRDVLVDFEKGPAMSDDLSDWGRSCLSPLSQRAYQTWIMNTTIFSADQTTSSTYQTTFAFPAEEAQYLLPSGFFGFVTEFFEFPGFFQVFVWDTEVRAEGSSDWTPATRWIESYRVAVPEGSDPATFYKGWGLKLARFRHRYVLEFSTDRTDTYFGLNDVITVPVLRCRPLPMGGCHVPGLGGGSRLSFKTAPAATTSRLAWTWKKGVVLSTDYGDPSDADGYALCAYDESGAAPQLVTSFTVPAGADCGASSCWVHGRRGPQYRSSSAAPDGVKVLDLVSGVGSARIKLTGKGPLLAGRSLGLPGQPMALPMRVQVQSLNGQCWETLYTTAKRNRAGEFNAVAN